MANAQTLGTILVINMNVYYTFKMQSFLQVLVGHWTQYMCSPDDPGQDGSQESAPGTTIVLREEVASTSENRLLNNNSH
jgi:hypothetical protein